MLVQPQQSLHSVTQPKGVVILGGAHGTLALARGLGQQNIPVFLVSNDTPLPGWSRYITAKFDWPGANDEGALAFLLQLTSVHGLTGCLLIAGGDSEVRLVSQSADILSSVYKVALTPWEKLRWVCEKPLLYRRARELDLAIPETYELTSVKQAMGADINFPVVLKPNMGGGQNQLSRAKVVRADDKLSFVGAFKDAADQIGAENVVTQQLIPGGGESQFSYAALWSEGRPVAEFTARRTRQYPVEFGYTSTFVEIVDDPEILTAARRLLASIEYNGLVEVEFKRDARDGLLKLLDVNPRPWSWFGLAAAAGVDLGAMLWAIANGREVDAGQARLGTAWMYLARDLVAGSILAMRGSLPVSAYVRSFASVRAWATFSANDPLPGLVDLPLTAWRVLTRRILR